MPGLSPGNKGAYLECKRPTLRVAVKELQHVRCETFAPDGCRLLDKTEVTGVSDVPANCRLSGADIALDDGEISRQHACIEVYGRRIILKDLGSTNGTFVDENKISQVQVENRSEFRIGASRLMLILTQEGTDPGTLT